MGALAERLGEDVEYWRMLGLLHDIDWGITKKDIGKHLTKMLKILRGAGFDEDSINTVISHLLSQRSHKNILWGGIVTFLINRAIIIWNEHRRSFKYR